MIQVLRIKGLWQEYIKIIIIEKLKYRKYEGLVVSVEAQNSVIDSSKAYFSRKDLLKFHH